MYAIAKRFPIEARRYAASLTYPAIEGVGRRTELPLDAEDRLACPIGAAGAHANITFLIDVGWSTFSPGPGTVADSLASRCPDVPWGVLYDEANEFTHEWDTGEIIDLAEAFGVKE